MVKINYLNNDLNDQTTKDDFFKIFEIQVKDHFEKRSDKDSIL
jgi:hypothetical protein